MIYACEIDWTAAAAWVQAIGSIAAIVAAIWIGHRSDKRARALVEDERKRQATVAASFLAYGLERLKIKVENAQSEVMRRRDSLQGGRPSAPLHWLLKTDDLVIFLPPDLERLRELALMIEVDVGVLVSAAFEEAERFNLDVAPLGDVRPAQTELTLVMATLTALVSRLDDLIKIIGKASDQIEHVHGIKVFHAGASDRPALPLLESASAGR